MPSLPSPRQSSLASDSLCQEESVIYYDNNSIIPHLCVGVLRVLKVCSPQCRGLSCRPLAEVRTEKEPKLGLSCRWLQSEERVPGL